LYDIGTSTTLESNKSPGQLQRQRFLRAARLGTTFCCPDVLTLWSALRRTADQAGAGWRNAMKGSRFRRSARCPARRDQSGQWAHVAQGQAWLHRLTHSLGAVELRRATNPARRMPARRARHRRQGRAADAWGTQLCPWGSDRVSPRLCAHWSAQWNERAFFAPFAPMQHL